MRQCIFVIVLLSLSFCAVAQNVTIRAVEQPAATVFRSLIEQTGKNFIYSSELLKDEKVTVTAENKPLKKVLKDMFKGTDIKFEIRGDNVVLMRKPKSSKSDRPTALPGAKADMEPVMLDEVLVVSRVEEPVVETSEIGAEKISMEKVIATPALLGESDVIKTLSMQPGISEGAEGTSGMHVHGGNADENLYMLDNVPIYQVNHFAGLFSAFNADAIRYIDFFKSSVPAKYDGRLSSFMDVRLKNGSTEGHHGSAKLGLTSGSFSLNGPIDEKTSYMVALRRSWYDLLTIPTLAILNSSKSRDEIRFRYYFMDLNARVNRRFSERLGAFASVYFGDDLLKTGSEDRTSEEYGWWDKDKYDFHWGNLVVQTGANYRVNPLMTSEFTVAYTRYFSSMSRDYFYREGWEDREDIAMSTARSITKTKNNINDWIVRGDFDWHPIENSRVRFGAGYTFHSFRPSQTDRMFTFDNIKTVARDSVSTYHASELNAYIEDDWRISERFRLNAGIHASLFHIDGKVYHGLAPRLSVSYSPAPCWAVKGAYSRTTQYVHQLSQSYLSLPVDQWVPVIGKFKPQTADKFAAGVYWEATDGNYGVSLEGYYKKMDNLIEYRDEYYLRPPFEMWDGRLTSGRGTAKGLDFKIEKNFGKLSGHIAYSLAWADRIFKDKNGGKRYPARFDNRHTINISVNWTVSERVQLNAAWTGHSGNRFTLLSQMWLSPDFDGLEQSEYDSPLRAPINNYQLPFYHRLDLSCQVKNGRGYWTFGLYNAYNHLNTVAIRRDYRDGKPVFQKVKLLPIIPSVSYTWQF